MKSPSHRDIVQAILAERGMARASEFRTAGVTATSLSRLEAEGAIVRLGRGLYQLADADYDPHHALAEAIKFVPRAVVCLTSALAFHELTDRQPRRVWLALGPREWRPKLDGLPVRYVHYASERLYAHVEHHLIEGVSVPITEPARTIVDLFKYRRTVGEDLAIEGLKQALQTGKVQPSELYPLAREARQWRIMKPYLEALSYA